VNTISVVESMRRRDRNYRVSRGDVQCMLAAYRPSLNQRVRRQQSNLVYRRRSVMVGGRHMLTRSPASWLVGCSRELLLTIIARVRAICHRQAVRFSTTIGGPRHSTVTSSSP